MVEKKNFLILYWKVFVCNYASNSFLLVSLQAWFSREVRFLEVTSVGVLDDSFDSLVSSRLALDAVAGIIASPERSPAVWQAVAKSVPKVVPCKYFTRALEVDVNYGNNGSRRF